MTLDPMAEWEYQRRQKRQVVLLILGGVALAVGAVVAWLFLRHGHQGDSCSSSDDCVGGRQCVYQADGTNPTCTATCSSDSDCPDDMECIGAQSMDDHGNTSFSIRAHVCMKR